MASVGANGWSWSLIGLMGESSRQLIEFESSYRRWRGEARSFA